MPCEAWSLVLRASEGWLEQEEWEEEEEVVVVVVSAVVLVGLTALSPTAAIRGTESEGHLHDGASSRQSHQAGNKWHPVVDWPTSGEYRDARRDEIGKDGGE
jgi:hypothetical protein